MYNKCAKVGGSYENYYFKGNWNYLRKTYGTSIRIGTYWLGTSRGGADINIVKPIMKKHLGIFKTVKIVELAPNKG